jgi:hypothetical protein
MISKKRCQIHPPTQRKNNFRVAGAGNLWLAPCAGAMVNAKDSMPCDCHCEENTEIRRHTLVLLLVINATMFCLELVVGILANSTALLADSVDMFADAAVYGIALYAVWKPHFLKRRAAFITGIFQGVLGWLSARSFGAFSTARSPPR